MTAEEFLTELRAMLRDELRAALVERPGDALDVDAVQARYRFADKRAARAVMHEAGAFKIGGKLHLHLEALERWERSRVELPDVPPRRRRAEPPRRRESAEPLRPGFWRE